METVPYFSIVIPALNEEKCLPLLLKDLSKQSIEDFEVIVVDGRSDDHTVERCLALKDTLPALKIVTSDIRNVSVQRNLGASNAKGRYLVFNDADNRLPKFFLEGLRYHLNSHPVDMFTTYCLPDRDTSKDKAIASALNLMIEIYNLTNNPGALGAMIGCLRNKFTGDIKFNPKVEFAEDTEFVRHGFQSGLSFGVIRDPKYVYSLRRFRKLGLIKTIQKSATLYIKQFAGPGVNQKVEYPMGGDYFKADSKTKLFIDRLEQSAESNKPTSKIIDKIKALISLEED